MAMERSRCRGGEPTGNYVKCYLLHPRRSGMSPDLLIDSQKIWNFIS